MGIFDFLTGEFIDVIHWTDDTRDTMVWRFERQGHEIKYGAKLTVREGQAAVFIHEGQLADVFTPGLYMLETNNMPIMTTLQHWDHGFKSALQVRDLFRQHHPVHRPEMGHQEPDHLPRSRIRTDAPARLRHLFDARHRPGQVHDRDRRHRRRIHHGRDQLPDPQHHRAGSLAACMAGSGIPVLDMAANTADLGKLVAHGDLPTIADYGLTMPEFYIENISLPPAVEAALDKRTSMGMAGDLGKFTQYSAAEAMTAAASNPAGGGMGAGLGAGMGMAMGQPDGAAGALGRRAAAHRSRSAAAPPPPPPPWNTSGTSPRTARPRPLSKARHLGRMATDGS